MTETYERIDLDARALVYAVSKLKEGGRLAASLSSLLEGQAGDFCTYLPAGINQSRVYDFEYSQIPEAAGEERSIEQDGRRFRIVPVHPAYRAFVTLISDYLNAHPLHLCVWEDWLTGRQSPRLVDAGVLNFTSGGQLLHVLSHRDSDTPAIVRVLEIVGNAWLVVGALTTMGQATLPSREEELEEGTMKQWCDAAQYVLVGAYDGDSLLLWSRR